MIAPKLRARIIAFVRAKPRTRVQIREELRGPFTDRAIDAALYAMARAGELDISRDTYSMGTPPTEQEAQIRAHLAAFGPLGERILSLAAGRVELTELFGAKSDPGVARARGYIIANLTDPETDLAEALRVSVQTIRVYRAAESACSRRCA